MFIYTTPMVDTICSPSCKFQIMPVSWYLLSSILFISKTYNITMIIWQYHILAKSESQQLSINWPRWVVTLSPWLLTFWVTSMCYLKLRIGYRESVYQFPFWSYISRRRQTESHIVTSSLLRLNLYSSLYCCKS